MTATEKNQAGSGRLRLAVAGTAIALVAGSAGAAVAQGLMAQRSPSSDAIAAVKGAGIQANINGRYRPTKPVLRKDLALALHRGLTRVAVQTTFDSVPSGSNRVDLGSLSLKVGGASGRTQGVLVTVHLEVDHDSDLAAGCAPLFEITKDGSTTVLETWTMELYDIGVGEEQGVSFSAVTTQATNTTSTYHLLGSNSCGQTMHTDEDVMTAQTVAFEADGTAHRVSPRVRPERDRER